MAVYVEKDGPVTIVTLSRPEVRNAVDRHTAQELSDAFRAFESDASARVAVLSGDRGHFCAGADLKEIAGGTPNRMATAPWVPAACNCRNRLLPPSPVMLLPVASSWPCGAI